MNYEKARDILLKKFDNLCGNYHYQNADKIEYEQALYDGAQALEKQMPKKVILGYDERDSICCPNCKGEIAEMDDYDYYKHNYCPDCGQALDWGDTE